MHITAVAAILTHWNKVYPLIASVKEHLYLVALFVFFSPAEPGHDVRNRQGYHTIAVTLHN